MSALRRSIVMICAALLTAAGVFGIVKFHSSPGGVVFHAFVLLCGVYLASTALRRQA